MKKITVKRNGKDVNGNSKYLYNFIDTDKTTPTEQKQINYKFGYFGRRTTKGISTQTSPNLMKEWLTSFAIWTNMEVGVNLGKAQKEIDRCNCKSGCNRYCSATRQSECGKLQKHSMLMDELSYIQDFLKLDIEEVNA